MKTLSGSALKLSFFVALIIGFVLSPVLVVHAAPISGSDAMFSWTTDTSTGLDWLDFDGGSAPSTVLRSKDDVAAQLGAGGDYSGWRFASNAEVYQFLLNVTGFSFLVATPSSSTVNNGATDLVAAWTGYTGMQGTFNNLVTVHGFTIEGYTGLLDKDPNLYSDWTLYIKYAGDLNTNEVYSEFGSWLVRGFSPPNPIPEPSTLLLMGTGLLMRIMYVWRRERPNKVIRLSNTSV